VDLAWQEGVTDGKKGKHTHTLVVPRSAHHTARETHMRDESFVNAHAARTHAGCHASTHAA